MTHQTFAVRLLKGLRDSIWQFVGVVIGILSVAVPLLLGYLRAPEPPEMGELMIYSTARKSFTNLADTLHKPARILIDGKEEKDVRLFVYFIQYKGAAHLPPAAFAEPIQGSVPADRKIIAVQSSPDTTGPFRVLGDGNVMQEEESTPVKFEHQIIDQQSFRIAPLLMNPDNWFKVEVYTASNVPAVGEAKKEAKATRFLSPSPTPAAAPQPAAAPEKLGSEVKWTCRVAGVRCPARFELKLGSSRLSTAPWPTEFQIRYQGWAIYFIVVFACAQFLIVLLFARSGIIAQPLSLREVLILSFGVISSLGFSEIIADWLFNGNSISSQPRISLILVLLHVSLLFVLLGYAVRRFRRGLRPPPPAGGGALSP